MNSKLVRPTVNSHFQYALPGGGISSQLHDSRFFVSLCPTCSKTFGNQFVRTIVNKSAQVHMRCTCRPEQGAFGSSG